jgi:glycosyltransferase involved in cell wall biosynthesis
MPVEGSAAGLNLHIVRNAVTHDSRVLKTSRSVAESGLFSAVEIAGFHEPGLAEEQMLDTRRLWRVRLRSRGLPKNLFAQVIKMAEWRWRLIDRYHRAPLRLIHCNDLEPLPIAVRLKRLTGAKLVYDAHELETERAGQHGIRQRLARATERHYLPWVDAIISVSPSICSWYEHAYPGTRVALVRNVPERPVRPIQAVDLRHRFAVPAQSLLFIYLGGVGKGRGVDNMLAAFADITVPHHLLVLGDGPMSDVVANAAIACPRIHALPAVPPDQVLAYASGADVGLSLIEDVSLSYRYCLPNKLFECVIAGLPVLVSDLPDQAQFVRDHGAGWITPNDVSAIVERLRTLDRRELARVSAGLDERCQALGWQHEASRLLDLYQSLLGVTASTS